MCSVSPSQKYIMNLILHDDWHIHTNGVFLNRTEQLEKLLTANYLGKLPTDPEQYWQIVGEVWKRTELPYANAQAWLEIFQSQRGRNARTEQWLDSATMLYRGINKQYADKDCDWSWTRDRDRAVWFSKRFSHRGTILEFDPKTDPRRVLCVFDDDEEQEVLLWSYRAEELYYEDEL